MLGKEVVQFGDQPFHGRNKFDQSFGDQHRPEVVAGLRAFEHNGCDLVHDIVERLVSGFHFFRDDANVRVRLQGAFQSDMRSRASHQFDEVPVFARRIAVALDISDYFRIDLACRIEAERRFYLLVFQIAVDRFRAADHLHAGSDRFVIFRQYAGIRIRVVAADNHERLNVELFQNLQPFVELFFLFQLRTS